MRVSAPWVVYEPRMTHSAARQVLMARRFAYRNNLPVVYVRCHSTTPVAPARTPLADAYAQDMEPNEASSSQPPHSQQAGQRLWSHTLKAHVRAQFVQNATSLLAQGHDLRSAVDTSAPVGARLDGAGGRERREELQCLLLVYLVTQRVLPLARITALWYPEGVFDAQLHTVPQHRAPALRRLQRAALYRHFHAQLDAGRLHAAACILHDDRLRPSQPKHLLALLLRRTARRHATPLLGTDPQQSARVALHEACMALIRRRPQTFRTSIALSMLEQLAARRMHTTLLAWTQLLSQMEGGALDARRLTHVARHLCRDKAYAVAYAYVRTLPSAWRTRPMYTALLVHYGNVMLDAAGCVSTADRTPSATLWRELCTTPHLAPPDADAYVARLTSHARHARALHAVRDARTMQKHCTLDAPTHAYTALCTLRALLRSDRWRLAFRFVRRYVRRHGAPPNATAWLNAMVARLVNTRLPDTVHGRDRSHLISCLYHELLRTTPADGVPHLPDAPVGRHALELYIRAVGDFAAACNVRPNRTTFLHLVRASARWDESLDTRALWHLAHLALSDPSPPTPAPPPDHTPMDYSRTPNGALLIELAAAFARRADHRSARSVRYLARLGRRRVRRSASAAPRALPPHRL